MALIPLSYGFDEQAHCVRVSALVVRNLPSAIALLSARFLLAQADVPTRQAYVVAVVDPSERTAAAAYTNTARYVTRPIAPLLAGLALRSALGRRSSSPARSRAPTTSVSTRCFGTSTSKASALRNRRRPVSDRAARRAHPARPSPPPRADASDPERLVALG